MENNIHNIIIIINISFLVIWGAYERISAIRKEKLTSNAGNNDQKSLIFFYSTIFLGYGIGIPINFTNYGNINLFFPYISMTGFVIILTGLIIRMMAILTLAEQFTYKVKIIENHKLIVKGIYKLIRHPSYLGQILIFLGSGLAFSNWISLIFLVIPILISTIYRIKIEEKVLIEHFSDEYINYTNNSKRLIPFVY